MKLLQTPLKVPYFEKYCPLNKKERRRTCDSIDGFNFPSKNCSMKFFKHILDNQLMKAANDKYLFTVSKTGQAALMITVNVEMGTGDFEELKEQ